MEIFSPLWSSRSNFSDTSASAADILVNYKCALWKWKRSFDYISRRGECRPPLSFVYMVDLNLRQNLSCFQSYCHPDHWIRYIGVRGSIPKQFPNFCSGLLLKYSKCASTFQSGLGKVSIDVPSSRSNPLLSCDPLQIWFNSPSLSGCILWSRNIPQNLPNVWKFSASETIRKVLNKYLRSNFPWVGPQLLWMPGIPLLKLGPPTCQIPSFTHHPKTSSW